MTRIDPGLKGVTVVTDPTAVMTPDGPRQDYRMVMPPDIFEQYRQGYRCMACHSVQSVAFPEVCETRWKDGGGCGYQIKRDQLRRLQAEHEGDEERWPDFSNAIGEQIEREEWAANNGGIWLPGDD